MLNQKHFVFLIILAVILKFSLFFYVEAAAPKAKHQIDTARYLESGVNLVSKGKFEFTNKLGGVQPEDFRTPGYPLFLGIIHSFLRIPLSGVIVIQVLLTLLTAWLTFKTALMIDEKIAPLSCIIILFDKPITAYSLFLLSETLFTLFMALFMYLFVKYLKHNSFKNFIVASVVLAIATYVRPGSYLIGLLIFLFLLFIGKDNLKKNFITASIFFFTVYSIIGLWHVRNYQIFERNFFTSAMVSNNNSDGLIGSYKRQDTDQAREKEPLAYYATVTFKGFVKILTDPGTLKYFDNKKLKQGAKLFAYPFMAFWLIGLLVGLTQIKGRRELAFLSLIIGYFTIGSILAVYLYVGSRYRIPMMPYIAIISAYGWSTLNFKFRH